MEWVCFDCRTLQYDDERGTRTEMMDRAVPGSYQTWTVCGRCGSDELVELSPEEIFEFFADLTKLSKAGKAVDYRDLELLHEMVEGFYG